VPEKQLQPFFGDLARKQLLHVSAAQLRLLIFI
jgi:hypothetical protein